MRYNNTALHASWMLMLSVALLLGSCDKNNDVVLFTIQRDIELGQQVAAEIASDPSQFPILSEAQYPNAYAHIRRIRDNILASGEVAYRDEFAWDIRIINDDILNAFATPGGHMYVYTGLIKFLETEDDLAGVIGHEIAHADQRHSVKQMQTQYGLSVLLGMASGENASQLRQITLQMAGKLAGLSFSRAHESEADKFSVIYLCPTAYKSDAAASFFEKLEANNQAPGVPEFLSTHPAPDRRIENIKEEAAERGCNTNALDPDTYQDLINSLP